MDKSKLQNLLSKQALILSYLKEQLEIVNFIRSGYDNDLPILSRNHFLISVSHNYYRSVVISTCALFHNHKYQANNFHLLVDESRKIVRELEPEAILNIKEKLTQSELFSVKDLVKIRNEEIGHFQFLNKPGISLNHKHLADLNSLYKLADEIIKIAADGAIDKEGSATYVIGLLNDDLISLQNLLEKASGYNFIKSTFRQPTR